MQAEPSESSGSQTELQMLHGPAGGVPACPQKSGLLDLASIYSNRHVGKSESIGGKVCELSRTDSSCY